MLLVFRKEGRTLMVLKKGIPFLSPFQNALLLECPFLLVRSPCYNRKSLDQQENPCDQEAQSDFPFIHPEPPKPPLS